MTYAIIYSSKTGNTALLARHLKESLPADGLTYFGPPSAAITEADVIFVGFWTDKGTADAPTLAFLKTLQNQNVFLFGTAGFGGDPDYFAQILNTVRENMGPSNTLMGRWMCQGRMESAVRARFEAMLPQQPDKARALLDNFDRALPHPDETDLATLARAAAAVVR